MWDWSLYPAAGSEGQSLLRLRGSSRPRPHVLLPLNIQIGIDFDRKEKGGAPEAWSQAIRDATVNLTPLRDGPVQLNAFFLLPPDKYPADLPHGPDLDNLLKRLLDALSETVLRELPGRDSAIEAINVRKQRVKEASEAGVFLTLITL